MRAWDRYAELSALLKDDASRSLKELRYVRPNTNPERLKQIEKDADNARSSRPLRHSDRRVPSMVHTVSGIVLHRLQRMVNTGDAPYESRVVYLGDGSAVKDGTPLFFEKVGWHARRG